MKKFLATVLALVLGVTMFVTAFAATDLSENPAGNLGAGEYTIGVTGSYKPSSTGSTISVDIEWEKMEFVYTAGGAEYNTETHKTTVKPGSWSDTPKNIIVTNHSDTAVDLEFAFEGNGDILGVFEFDECTVLAASYAGGIVDEQERQYVINTFKIDLNSPAISEDSSLGTITVTVKKSTADPDSSSDTSDDSSVDITPSEDGWIHVSSSAKLQAALNAGGNIILDDSITVEGALDYFYHYNDVTTVLDLNGNVLTGAVDVGAGKFTVKDSAGGGEMRTANHLSAIMMSGSGSPQVFTEGGTIQAMDVKTGRAYIGRGTTINPDGFDVAVRVGDDGYLIVAGAEINADGAWAVYVVFGAAADIFYGNVSGWLHADEDATLNIEEGTFTKDPTEYVNREKSDVTETEDGKYIVSYANPTITDVVLSGDRVSDDGDGNYSMLVYEDDTRMRFTVTVYGRFLNRIGVTSVTSSVVIGGYGEYTRWTYNESDGTLSFTDTKDNCDPSDIRNYVGEHEIRYKNGNDDWVIVGTFTVINGSESGGDTSGDGDGGETSGDDDTPEITGVALSRDNVTLSGTTYTISVSSDYSWYYPTVTVYGNNLKNIGEGYQFIIGTKEHATGQTNSDYLRIFDGSYSETDGTITTNTLSAFNAGGKGTLDLVYSNDGGTTYIDTGYDVNIVVTD